MEKTTKVAGNCGRRGNLFVPQIIMQTVASVFYSFLCTGHPTDSPSPPLEINLCPSLRRDFDHVPVSFTRLPQTHLDAHLMTTSFLGPDHRATTTDSRSPLGNVEHSFGPRSGNLELRLLPEQRK